MLDKPFAASAVSQHINIAIPSATIWAQCSPKSVQRRGAQSGSVVLHEYGNCTARFRVNSGIRVLVYFFRLTRHENGMQEHIENIKAALAILMSFTPIVILYIGAHWK
jgi:hypothetical protein